MFSWLKQLLSTKDTDKSANGEALATLQESFKRRYHSFQRLLAANQNALGLMTEIEEMIDAGHPTSMAFVRSRTTRLAAAVFQIIKHLDTIAPKKYDALYEQLKTIQTNIASRLDRRTDLADVPLVMPLDQVNVTIAEQVGGKMAALGELGTIPGITIPPGFAITAKGYRCFVEQTGIDQEINRIIQLQEAVDQEGGADLSAKIEALILAADLPAELEQAIMTHYQQLMAKMGNDAKVAMRSSAVGEDSHDMSFAGQYRSVLDVPATDLLMAYKTVVASKYSTQAMAYRLHYGIRDDDVDMCVGCMPMIDASFGGVVYTASPLDSANDAVFIYAVAGLPQQVVDGSAAADAFIVSKTEPSAVSIKPGDAPNGSKPSQEALRLLADQAGSIESHFGGPQDIEWVIDRDNALIMLQSRPLRQTLEAPSSPDPEASPDTVPPLASGGTTASRGVGAGPVFIATQREDAAKFPPGAVLITAQPLPFWATLLDRAAAVITEQGSVACHLANLAREFGVPALFNVNSATDQFTPDQTITVDADARKIYQGRIEALLNQSPKPQPIVHNSPVHRTLKEIAKFVLPLRLIDPEEENFTPEHCETLHDITRFCHEKAVYEMFHFGVEHHFPQVASRRLFTDVATQFWIIDLDDGLSKDATDPYFVKIDEIVSIPMLAIWRGMKSLAWSGPPPVDARGFFQVVAESTMDTNLNSTAPSDYSAGSHFMIAKNYCSLQSRFGYHYATVETIVGDRPLENFISFRFGGGGANQERQIQRARLIAEILDVHGFRADQRKDMVDAQLGGYDQTRMSQALEVVGYLLVHTRQLDMVMSDGETFNRYKADMLRDLEKIGK
ncbi:MAG: PEP/pyruvate-binding domain-containing protein [Myxococcota bacterium]|nr:PEP/pyruvate-binding domain-containing protein [Myxococcota bacterium]